LVQRVGRCTRRCTGRLRDGGRVPRGAPGGKFGFAFVAGRPRGGIRLTYDADTDDEIPDDEIPDTDDEIPDTDDEIPDTDDEIPDTASRDK
jgi:hypothetical protein